MKAIFLLLRRCRDPLVPLIVFTLSSDFLLGTTPETIWRAVEGSERYQPFGGECGTRVYTQKEYSVDEFCVETPTGEEREVEEPLECHSCSDELGEIDIDPIGPQCTGCDPQPIGSTPDPTRHDPDDPYAPVTPKLMDLASRMPSMSLGTSASGSSLGALSVTPDMLAETGPLELDDLARSFGLNANAAAVIVTNFTDQGRPARRYVTPSATLGLFELANGTLQLRSRASSVPGQAEAPPFSSLIVERGVDGTSGANFARVSGNYLGEPVFTEISRVAAPGFVTSTLISGNRKVVTTDQEVTTVPGVD